MMAMSPEAAEWLAFRNAAVAELNTWDWARVEEYTRRAQEAWGEKAEVPPEVVVALGRAYDFEFYLNLTSSSASAEGEGTRE